MQNFDLPVYETFFKITGPTSHASCQETKISDYVHENNNCFRRVEKTSVIPLFRRVSTGCSRHYFEIVIKGKIKIIKGLGIQDVPESNQRSFYRENCLTHFLRLI